MMSAAGSWRAFFVQDLCVRIFCARSLCQDVCIRILWGHWCKISLSGSLHQDVCRTTCRRLGSKLHKRNFTSIPRDRHAPSPQKVTHGNQKSQLYQHFARWTRTISAEGCTMKSEIATYQPFARWTRTISAEGCTSKSKFATLPAFRAAEGSHFETMLQKYCACHQIMSRGLRNAHWPRKSIPKLKFLKRNPSQELSPLTSKYKIHGTDSLRLPRKTQSFQ